VNERISDPVGVGQLLDRAVATYVRALFPVLAILAAGSIPAQLILSLSGGAARLARDSAQLKPTLDPALRAVVMQHFISDSVVEVAALLAGGAFTVLSGTACLIYVRALADGEPATIGGAFRRAVPRWFAEIGLIALVAGVACVAFVALLLVVLVASTALAFAGAFRSSSPTFAAYALLVVMVVLFLIVGLALSLVQQIGAVEIATGDRNAFRVLGATGRRLFDRRRWRSTLAVGGVLLAITLLTFAGAFVAGALLRGAAAFAAVGTIAGSLLALVISGLLQCFIVLYARDLHDRRTGEDLIRLAEQAPA
jgi:hypothetical protein